jgi:hypothetical protein
MKRIRIQEITFEELSLAISKATSIGEVLDYFARSKSSGNYALLRHRADELNLTLPRYGGGNLKAWATRRHDDETFFAPNTARGTHKVRKRMRERGVPYSCSNTSCRDFGIVDPIVAGVPLGLEIDHLDGNHSNNTFENLRFLCPNCHSQTSTYAGRGRRIDQGS